MSDVREDKLEAILSETVLQVSGCLFVTVAPEPYILDLLPL